MTFNLSPANNVAYKKGAILDIDVLYYNIKN